MKRMYSALLGCAAVLAFTGCTYEDAPSDSQAIVTSTQGPASSAAFILPEPLVVGMLPAATDVQLSKRLPEFGECSFNQASRYPIGDVRYLGPTYAVPGLARDAWRIHLEAGLTTSWSQATYLDIRALTPGVKTTPAKIFRITRESFESLAQNSDSLKNIVTNVGISSMVDAFYVTSRECMPLGGIK